jgi:hypothetical protein
MSKIRYLILSAATIATATACSERAPAPAVDDALRNDLSLAAQVRAQPQQFVGPAELGYAPQAYPQGYPPQYAPQGYPQYAPQPYYQPVYAAPAPAPAVRRTTSARRSSGGSSAGSSSGTIYRAPAPQRTRTVKHTHRDAAIGAVAGAAIGVATSAKKDRLKGGLIGAVAGGALGAVIGNNVDVRRVPVPE